MDWGNEVVPSPDSHGEATLSGSLEAAAPLLPEAQRRRGGDRLPVWNASFSGHESFPLRFAWLKKGHDGIASNPAFFATPEAMVEMGTGKNMVRAIRYWGLASGAWEEVPATRGRHLRNTPFGLRLLRGSSGWDPFLEDLATVWLLHWQLVTNLHRATTWSWMFSRPTTGRFSKDEILGELEALAAEMRVKKSTRPSLRRDLDVFVNTYLRTSSRRGDLTEDALDCPLRQLGLLRPAGERGTYEFSTGRRESLPDGIFTYALIDYAHRVRTTSTPTIALDSLAYAPLSPGRVFRLTEDELAERLVRATTITGEKLRFDETAGLRQVIISRELPDGLHLLDDVYKGRL